jgi:carbon-monoxide dehydrogenase medium subunit
VSVGPNGETVTPANDFFITIFTTTLSPDEVATAIRIPKAPAGAGVAYEKLANQASGYAIVGVAAVVANGAVKIGVTGVADRAFRASNAETALASGSLDEATVRQATRNITDGAEAMGDIHASESYRRRVADGLAARAVQKAASRAGN